MTYILADARFFDEAAAQQFKSVEQYNQMIIDNCNSVVTNEDTLLLMGIISKGDELQTQGVINFLNGKKIIPDFSEKNFSKKFWNSINISTYTINGFINGTIKNKNSTVNILSTSKDLIKNLSIGYCAAPYSLCTNKQLYHNRILNLSTDQFDYYPVDYEQIPSIINFKLQNNLGGNE